MLFANVVLFVFTFICCVFISTSARFLQRDVMSTDVITMSRDPSLLPQASYHDMRSLDSLRDLRSRDEKSALKAAAQQFEATFLNMLMKSMRDANEVFGDDDVMGGDSVEFYQTMHDEQLAATLSAQGTLGLAELMVKQLSPAVKTEPSAPVQSPEDFVSQVRPHAERAAKRLGVAPEALIAQAALETGWGKSLPHNGNNCFGIKADERWTGQSVTRKTMEVHAGVVSQVNARFRRYDDIGASFDDYVTFVQTSERYASAQHAATPEQFVQSIAKAGYATDPLYAEKLTRILASAPLRADRS